MYNVYISLKPDMDKCHGLEGTNKFTSDIPAPDLNWVPKSTRQRESLPTGNI